MALAYGAATSASQEKATRSSVLIGPDGVVLAAFPAPDPAAHADEVLAIVRGG